MMDEIFRKFIVLGFLLPEFASFLLKRFNKTPHYHLELFQLICNQLLLGLYGFNLFDLADQPIEEFWIDKSCTLVAFFAED